MNRLFSKSELKAIKQVVNKQKNYYIHNIEETTKEEVKQLDGLYNVVSRMENNNKYSRTIKALK